MFWKEEHRRSEALPSGSHLSINLYLLIKALYSRSLGALKAREHREALMASPLEMTEMYDNALLGILQHVGNIQDFLQIYFGFLYRKTDFYRLLSGPNDKMGFPPGVAEKMVFKVKSACQICSVS